MSERTQPTVLPNGEVHLCKTPEEIAEHVAGQPKFASVSRHDGSTGVAGQYVIDGKAFSSPGAMQQYLNLKRQLADDDRAVPLDDETTVAAELVKEHIGEQSVDDTLMQRLAEAEAQNEELKQQLASQLPPFLQE